MYPNQAYAGFHPNSIGTWNKSTVPQNSQGIGYAFSYARPEMAYVEKRFSNPYGSFYAPAENEYYRQHYSTPGSQQSTQWMQSNFSQYVPSPHYRRSECYNRHSTCIPNTTRPPPTLKTDNVDNTFHASLSLLENPTQNSAAAYTANWVSSTSSIPPELRDEPERDDFVASASAVSTPPASSFTEQFSNLSVHEKQWSGLGHSRNGGNSGGHGRRRRIDARERHVRQSPKELTWDERIRKGAVRKERVEQRGSEKSESGEGMDRDSRESNFSGSRQRGQRGSRSIVSGSERAGGERLPSPAQEERDVALCKNDRDQVSDQSTRNHCNRSGDRRNQFDRRPRMEQQRTPQYHRQGIPLMAKSSYYNTGSNRVPCVTQQDQRFRNTWLDANLGLNYGQMQMVDYPTFFPYGHRPQHPPRGRSGYRYSCKNAQTAKEFYKNKSENQSVSAINDSVEMRRSTSQGESPEVYEEEEVWEIPSKDRKHEQDASFYWSLGDEQSQKGQEEKGEKFEASGTEQSNNDSTTASTVKIEVPCASVSR